MNFAIYFLAISVCDKSRFRNFYVVEFGPIYPALNLKSSPGTPGGEGGGQL